jgi:UDP-N-acetyl-D-mannosaminuronic acid transferase (WecB/TagA/CpsF family)
MSDSLRRILGIPFYIGTLEGLLSRTLQGGLIVVPSAPVLVDMQTSDSLRQALQDSDLALTDSGFLVLLLRWFKRQRLPRISGLRYLRALLVMPEFRAAGAAFWVMPSADDAHANSDWLWGQGIAAGGPEMYVAPMYPAGPLEDAALLARIEARKPKFVMLNIGGGTQERLGHFLRSRLSYRPAIICTGAAVAFLSGRQARIPVWADRLFLGWLLRSLDDPKRFIPRYWKALRLVPLILKAT